MEIKVTVYHMGMLYKTRGGRQRFFCASALASAKPKKAQKSKEKRARKKAKAPRTKGKKHAFALFLILQYAALETQGMCVRWVCVGGKVCEGSVCGVCRGWAGGWG